MTIRLPWLHKFRGVQFHHQLARQHEESSAISRWLRASLGDLLYNGDLRSSVVALMTLIVG